MKPILPFRLPRLYVSIIVYAILFTTLNIIIFYYGQNLFLIFQTIWSWAGILLMAMIGAMLIGMVLAYRVIALREFTPFEKEMMEMRLEVTELTGKVDQILEKVAPTEGDGGEDDISAED